MRGSRLYAGMTDEKKKFDLVPPELRRRVHTGVAFAGMTEVLVRSAQGLAHVSEDEVAAFLAERGRSIGGAA